MAQKDRCNHAYGLEIIRCTECGSQIASRCPVCAYEGRCDDHAVTCSQGSRRRDAPRGEAGAVKSP